MGVERAATAARRRGRVAFFDRARATAEIVSLDESAALRAGSYGRTSSAGERWFPLSTR